MDSLSSHSFYESISSSGLGFGYEGKSHVNVTFALVPLKRLNSVKVCDKMSTSSLVRGALGAWGRCVGGVACVELSFYARLAPSRAARNRQSMAPIM